MSPRDSEVDLSAYLDDALDSVEREAVRLRIERDPEARRAVRALGAASAALRQTFAADVRDAAAVLSPPPSLTPAGLAAADAGSRRGVLLRRALYVLLAAAACLGGYFLLRGETPAAAGDRVAAAAARVVTAEEAYVEIVASAPAAALLLGSSPSVHGVLGPGGRFYGEIKMPSGGRSGGAMALFGPLAAPMRRAAGGGGEEDENVRRGARTMHAGFDGDQLWRYAEGDAHVDVAPIDPSALSDAREQLRTAFGADLLFGASGPELGFSAWREIATQAAEGKFEVTPAGDRPFENGKLAMYVVRARESVGAKVRQATVGVDASGDLRLIEVNMFRVTLRRMTAAPPAERFSFRAYAPADAELRPIALPKPPKLPRPRNG